jgi:hypothetical protein
MAEASRRDSLRTEVFGGMHKHPDGAIRDFPYPLLHPVRRKIISTAYITVGVYVQIAFERPNVLRAVTRNVHAFRLGSPEDLPEKSERKPLTLGKPYADFFRKLDSADPNAAKPNRGVTFISPLPTGLWFALKPDVPEETHGVFGVTDDKQQNRVFFFASKAQGRAIQGQCTWLSDRDKVLMDAAVAESALPAESPVELLELTGDLADWMLAYSLISRTM